MGTKPPQIAGICTTADLSYSDQRTMESLRWEKVFKIESNHQPITMATAKPRPQVPHPGVFGTLPDRHCGDEKRMRKRP